MRRISSLWLPVITLIVSLNILSCAGGGGSPANQFDTGFGTGGKTTTAIGTVDDTPFAMAIQSDDRLVVAGYSDNGSQRVFALARYNTDGSLDTTFNSAGSQPGIVTASIGTVDDAAYALAIQSDGKLVAAGYTNYGTLLNPQYRIALVRFETNGDLDTSFGTNGIVITSIRGIDDEALSLVVQSDGKLVIAGYSYNGSTGVYEFSLVRYNMNGSPDPAFGTGGIVTTAIRGPASVDDKAFALAVQTDGKLVAAGYSYNSTTDAYEFALARYNDTDGSLDSPVFGTGGVATTAIRGAASVDDVANALSIQSSDGKLVAAGKSFNSITGAYEFALARYDTDGTPDAGFGTGGSATTSIGSIDDEANALAVQPDGKLVAAGYSDTGSQFKFAVARYNTNGTLDTAFHSTGKVTTAVGMNDAANAVAVQPDGKPVAAGYSLQNSRYEFALIRYLP
jgi:uncharacterized delta-60 repeat protein